MNWSNSTRIMKKTRLTFPQKLTVQATKSYLEMHSLRREQENNGLIAVKRFTMRTLSIANFGVVHLHWLFDSQRSYLWIFFSQYELTIQRYILRINCKLIVSVYFWEPYIFKSGADPGFPVGGGSNSGGVPTYHFAKFFKKLQKIEKFLGRNGILYKGFDIEMSDIKRKTLTSNKLYRNLL